MNLSYLRYAFKKYRIIYLLLTLIYCTSFSFLLVFLRDYNTYLLKSLIYIPAAIFIAIAYILPIIDYRVYFDKNSANVFFALPDRRANIYRTTLYFHLFMNILIYSFSFSLGMLILMSNHIVLSYHHLFAYMGYSILIFIGVYFLSSFITTKCSNIFDAIIINLLYLILPAIFILTMYVAFNVKTLEWSKISYIGAIQKLCRFYPQVAITDVNSNYGDWYVPIIMAGVGIFLHFLAIRQNVHFKPENIGDLSKSFWGYRTLIPLIAFAIFLNTNWQNGFVSFFILGVTILVYLIYTMLSRKKSPNYQYVLLIIFLYLLANALVLLV